MSRSTRTMTMSVTPELRELIKRRAAELGVSVSRHMRELVRKDVARCGPVLSNPEEKRAPRAVFEAHAPK